MKKLLLPLCLLMIAISMQALEVKNLRTQATINPIGIDIQSPSLSWMLESNQRGVMQTSYSIRIATDAGFANVVWESGQVESDQSSDVQTSFAPAARTRYYWQVSVTDNKGNTATSTEKAYFETGLMGADGWGATKWIKATKNPQGYVAPEEIKNYEMSVEFDIRSVSAGVIFAAKDHNNYYMWQVNLEQSTPRLRPHQWAGGNPALLAEKNITGVTIHTGEKHVMKIVVTGGNKAVTYIDGVQVDSRTGDFAYGDFGFREDYASIGDESAYFDDFVVTAGESTLLSEDFETEDVMFTNGTVTNGRFLVVGRGTYAWQRDKSEKVRYDVDVDMTLIRDDASICFSATGENTYMMWAINTYNMSTPVVRRHVYNNSTDPVYSDTQIPFSKSDLIGKPHHIKIECESPYVRTYIDGQLVDTYTDNGVLAIGDLGFRVYCSNNGTENEQAYFDNLVMTTYDAVGNASTYISEDFESESNIFSADNVQSYEGSRQLFMSAPSGNTFRLMQNEGSVMPGAPMVRKEFGVDGAIKSARLYASGLGVYNVYINGTRVGQTDDDGNTFQDELKPGSTDFKKTVFYTTHDVTSLLHAGQNAIGAEVTSGWWNGGVAHGEFGNHDCAFRGVIIITYEDGHEAMVNTDLTWTSNTNGALRKGDIYNGESYDARLESNWSEAGYDDADWFAVAESKDFKGEIISFEGPAIRVVPELDRLPKEINVYEGVTNNGKAHGALNKIQSISGDGTITLKAGQTAIYDFAQNAAGWVKFTAKGKRGTKLRFRFSEMLNTTGDAGRGDDGPEGSLYLINLRSAEASLHYTLKGTAEGETFHPTSTYYGFRYIEITTSSDVEISNVVGETVTSAMTEKSSLETSHADVNQLYSNCMWGQRSNFISVPTDCPQRDERLGWAADTQVYSLAGMYNADSRTFYKKWMRDMRDSQRSDGAYPHVAPFSWNVGYGHSAWADAGIIVPWKIYLMTGDEEVLLDNIDSMEKYMTFLGQQHEDGYTYVGGGTMYGDWLSFASTDNRYISVCYYAYDAQLMEKMCQVLAKYYNKYSRKATNYHNRFESIKKEWQERYLKADGTPKFDTQCAYLMALRYNLLPDEASIEATKAALQRNISNNGDKLTTGFLGTAILNHTLTQFGMDDEAFTLLLQRDCPSWLYSVDQGATTVWERWNSYTIANGFGDPGMNSFNHYAYGAISEWMFRYMAGIAPDEENTGFKHIILQPSTDTRKDIRHNQQRITWVDASFWSNYGDVKAYWNCDGSEEMTYDVTIPANTTATLYMPCSDGVEVLEGGIAAGDAEGIEFVGRANGKAVYNVGSGTYQFSTQVSQGIKDVAGMPLSENTYYNLQGIRMNNDKEMQKGVYIVNGKKVVK